MRRPPVILWRALSADMLRLLAVTTLALVVVISFAGAIRPLADGRLTFDQALLFMALLAVPMTQFALPFAAGFAATLSYHRFAADNEAMAAGASGLGHRTLLTPAAVVGLVLSLGLGVLSFELIPGVLREAQRMLVTDGTRLLVAQLNKGEAVRLSFGGSEAVELYADRAYDPEPANAETGAREVITLEGVLAVQSVREGEPLFTAAERVFLFLFDDPTVEDATLVQLVFQNASGNAADGQEGTAEQIVTRRLRLPTEFSDDPKYLSWGGMREAIRTPRTMSKTDRDARVLEARLAERDALNAMRTTASGAGAIEFEVVGGGGEVVGVRAGRLDYEPRVPEPDAELMKTDPERAERRAMRNRTDRWRLVPPAGAPEDRVAAVRVTPDGRRLGHWAQAAYIELDKDRPSASVGPFTLVLEDVYTFDGDAPEGGALTGSESSRTELTYTDLLPEGLDADRWSGERLRPLLREARREVRGEDPGDLGPRIGVVVDAIERRVEEQEREILSKRHERLAFSVTCLLMTLCGATIAMRMRESLPLPVYLWSFLPALGSIIAISAGQRITHRSGEIGLVLLWAGVIGLLGLLIYTYNKVARH